MRRNECLLLFVFIACYASASSLDECNLLENCGDCLQSSVSCSWCAGYALNSTLPRCFTSTNDTCPVLVNPANSVSLTQDFDFEELLQIKPQMVDMKLRVGVPQDLPFTVRPSRGNPLDLYFLIDYSGSLVDFIDALKNVTQELATTLGNVSDNYRVGLGIFVDKPVKPFMSSHPDKKDQPFSFINVLNFTANASKLVDALSERNGTTNLDAPEGLMDGLMQVAVCPDVINWREDARRLVFTLTDATFKSAGHGRYAGILTPNDGHCHLSDNEYAAATDFDYASMGHLAKVYASNEIIPLFGIPEVSQNNLKGYHKGLSEAVDGARVVVIQDNSLVQTIDTVYKELSSEVRALAEIPTSVAGLTVDVTLEGCPPGATQMGQSCLSTPFEEKVNFTATFHVTQCTDELRQGTEVTIRSVFFGAITVNVQAICSCLCEEEKPTTNSEQCSDNGKVVCGKCECDTGSYGTFCQCAASGNGTVNVECPKGANGLDCSGEGTCDCGECVCNEGYYSFDCGCNDNICPIAKRDQFSRCNDLPCVCGACQCGSNYSGDSCDCPTAQDLCIPDDGSGAICSGQGQCMCNECQCREGYGGNTCQFCIDGDICEIAVNCPDLDPCVNCYTSVQDSKVLMAGSVDECSEVCGGSVTLEVSNAPASSTGLIVNGTQANECTIAGGGNCQTIRYFAFGINVNSTYILVVNTPANCVPEVEPWVIAVPIVVGLLILGIILLIAIKLFLVLMDHLEYRKFVKDVQDNTAGNMINPLYTAPQQQIDNPLYRGNNN